MSEKEEKTFNDKLDNTIIRLEETLDSLDELIKSINEISEKLKKFKKYRVDKFNPIVYNKDTKNERRKENEKD